MIRLLIVHDMEYKRRDGIVRWAYARRSHALKKYAPDDFHVDRCASKHILDNPSLAEKYDIIFTLDYMILVSLRQKLPGKTIVASFNRDSRTRGNMWDMVVANCDYLICNNMDVWEHHGRQEKTCCIPNGVDVELFAPKVPWEDREFDIIWCGSTSERKCKNYFSVIEPLSKHFKASFIPIQNALDLAIKPENELIDWYNTGKIVLCASHSEGGGPSYLMEAMACGCAPVTTWIGSVPDFHHITNHPICDQSVDSFIRGIELALNNPSLSIRARNAMLENRYGGENGREKVFYWLFRELLDGRAPEPFSYRDTD